MQLLYVLVASCVAMPPPVPVYHRSPNFSWSRSRRCLDFRPLTFPRKTIQNTNSLIYIISLQNASDGRVLHSHFSCRIDPSRRFYILIHSKPRLCIIYICDRTNPQGGATRFESKRSRMCAWHSLIKTHLSTSNAWKRACIFWDTHTNKSAPLVGNCEPGGWLLIPGGLGQLGSWKSRMQMVSP